MTTKHDIEEQVSACPYRILLPVARATRLRVGLFQDIVAASRTPKLYTELAAKWEEKTDGQSLKDKLYAQQGYLWGKVNLVIIPVKSMPLEMPTVPIASLAEWLAKSCKRNGCAEVAVAKHLWRNQRYTAEDVQALIDGLEKAGIGVHEYE